MKLLSSLIAAGSILVAAENVRAGGMIEVMAGEKNMTSDIKVLQPLSKKTSLFFFRNRTSYDYATEKATPFTLADFNYNLKGGINLTLEAQVFPNGEISPRLGLEYFKKLRKDLTLYALGTANIDDQPKNLETVFCLRYTPQITKNNKFLSQLEGVINFGDQNERIGHNFTALRGRMGPLHKNGISYGLAIDLNINGNKPNTTHQIGAYFRKEF